MKINGIYFETYEQYKAAYVKKWEVIHKHLPVDLNWCENDWIFRLSENNQTPIN